MKMRALGSTKLKLSAVGLGTWASGEEGHKKGLNPRKDRDFLETVLGAPEMGVNWVDTAPSYGFGYSEKAIGQAVKLLKEKLLISTKCGLINKNNKIYNCLDPESIRSEIETSLSRLGLEAIDLYQIHNPIPDKKIERAWEVLAQLCAEKKARYIGVSNFSLEQLKRIKHIRAVDFIQVRYSMLVSAAEGDLFNYCADNGIGILTYSPIERGLLAGKFTEQAFKNLVKDDYRRRNPLFADRENFDLVELLRPIALRNKMSLAQLAIAWILRRPEITSVIAGARAPWQIKETAASADFNICEPDLEKIGALLKKRNR